MNKSKKNLAVLCTSIFVILGMWLMLSVHCQAAETNNDEKQQTQTIRIGAFEDTFNYVDKNGVRRGYEDLATNLCRLWQAIPDGSLSM